MSRAQFQGPVSPGISRRGQFGKGLLILLLSAQAVMYGCKVGPDYHPPSALGTNSFPAQYSEVTGTNATAWKPATPVAHLPRGWWWQVFGDPELDRLETI